MRNVILYHYCTGAMIDKMFSLHKYTKDKFNSIYIPIHQNIPNSLDANMIELLEKCNVFIHLPFTELTLLNGDFYTESDYSITNLKKYLKPECIIIRIDYYRFKGFWYECTYKPYYTYKNYSFFDWNYSFLDWKDYGIHNSFINFSGTKKELVDKINNLIIDKENFLTFFKEELEKFKKIDDTSDIKMYDFLINNYKTKHLFHDIVHPTNIFFYEMFRQIVFKLTNYELSIDDPEFIDMLEMIEMTHWSLPILPSIKTILDLEIPNIVPVFFPEKIYMDVYDYYYIRLSHDNFENYLKDI